MQDSNRSVRLAAVGVLVAGSVLVGGSAASAAWASSTPAGVASQTASEQAAACSLGANNPSVSSDDIISGTGSRTGCGGTVTLTVQVRKHRTAWPDKAVAESKQTGFSNGSLRASGECDGNGTYFTETRSSSGNKISSGRVNRC